MLSARAQYFETADLPRYESDPKKLLWINLITEFDENTRGFTMRPEAQRAFFDLGLISNPNRK